MNNKRGQITIFIIIGIILLFIVALTIYFSSSFNKVRPPVQQLLVDDELKPIQVYVTDCLSATAKEGLIRLGQNGGYITVPSGMKIDPVRPQNSDAIFFDPQVIPYWYYMKPCSESSIGCIIVTNPSVCEKGVRCIVPYTGDNSIEEQLNTFIETNIDKCLANFEPFKDRYDITTGKIVVDTRIAESEVGFKLDYPLDVKIIGSNRNAKIPYFYTEHEVNLGKIYKFALEIRDAEQNYTFLERNTLNLISVYSGIDSNKLPPMSGMDILNFEKKYWIHSEVKEKLMSDILPYTMLLQITNAGNYQKIYSRSTDPKTISFEDGLYESMTLQVSNNTYFELDANIYYPQDSEIYFRIGDNEIIKPDTFDAGDDIFMKIIGFVANDYSFRYDLTYPVIVSIKDRDAFNGEGYVFNYAMQANIRQNVPISGNMTTVNLMTAPSIDMDDMSQRVDRLITIESYNKYTKEPLGDVLISYRCGEQFTIGKTIIKNGKAILSEKFPFCEFGGEIIYEKVGYSGGAIDYSNTEGNTPQNFRIELWPLQEKKIKVYVRSNEDINAIRDLGANGILTYNTKYSLLTANDTVFLNIARIKDDPRESDVPLVGFLLIKSEDSAQQRMITKDDQIEYVNLLFTSGEINESVKNSMIYDIQVSTYEPEPVVVTETDYILDFIPGTYNVDAFMTYDGLINIPEERRILCSSLTVMGVCIGGETEMVLPEQNFSSWIIGGLNIDFTLTENDIYANNTLVLFVAKMPLPKNWNELESTPSIEAYQQDKIAFLSPTMEYP
ncbi:MAG: hypothetical protein ACP5N1_02345 [Candidatus Woesearchaeota archaeon]